MTFSPLARSGRPGAPLLAASLFAGLALSACGTKLPPPATSSVQSECDADGLAGYIGMKAKKKVLAGIQHDRRDQPVRFNTPGTPATLNDQPNRLNVDIDKQKIITALHCG